MLLSCSHHCFSDAVIVVETYIFMIISSNNTRYVRSVTFGSRSSATGVKWIIIRYRMRVFIGIVSIAYKIVSKSNLAACRLAYTGKVGDVAWRERETDGINSGVSGEIKRKKITQKIIIICCARQEHRA